MSAHVIDFVSAAARQRRIGTRAGSEDRDAAARDLARPAAVLEHDFKFWTGASGKRYVHTLYGLIDCPEVDNCNVLLVRRDADGHRQVMHVGRLEHDAPSLNLAEIRHIGATLGVNEVYVHLLAETSRQRRFVEIDLQAALAASNATRANAG